MKKKALLSSILTIVLCISLIAGSTFALFTSMDEVNVAVNAGHVEIVATIEDESLKTWSLEIEQPYGEFANGGTAEIDAVSKNLELDLMTPGDKVQFNIKVENLSNVHTLYRIRAVSNGVEGAKDLTPALYTTAVIERGGVKEEYVVGGAENASPWGHVLAGEDYADILVTVEFPDAPDNNDYMDAKANISFVVDAVQGNADTMDLQTRFTNGGNVSSGNVANDVDASGLNVYDEDVTLYDIVLTQKNAEWDSYIIGMENPEGVLTLDEGTLISVSEGGLGVVMMGGTLVINDGAKISAKDGGYCLMAQISYETTLMLNGSDWFETDGETAPILVTTAGTPFNVIITTDNPLSDAEYIAMLGYEENTLPAGVNIKVNGRLIQDTTNG